SSEIFQTHRVYQLPALPHGTHYCGYVVERGPVERAHEIRETIALGRPRAVFVSAGGGGDGEALMRTYVDAVRLLGARVEFGTLMAIGANAPPGARVELEAKARGLPLRIVPYVQHGRSHMAAADHRIRGQHVAPAVADVRAERDPRAREAWAASADLLDQGSGRRAGACQAGEGACPRDLSVIPASRPRDPAGQRADRSPPARRLRSNAALGLAPRSGRRPVALAASRLSGRSPASRRRGAPACSFRHGAGAGRHARAR